MLHPSDKVAKEYFNELLDNYVRQISLEKSKEYEEILQYLLTDKSVPNRSQYADLVLEKYNTIIHGVHQARFIDLIAPLVPENKKINAAILSLFKRDFETRETFSSPFAIETTAAAKALSPLVTPENPELVELFINAVVKKNIMGGTYPALVKIAPQDKRISKIALDLLAEEGTRIDRNFIIEQSGVLAKEDTSINARLIWIAYHGSEDNRITAVKALAPLGYDDAEIREILKNCWQSHTTINQDLFPEYAEIFAPLALDQNYPDHADIKQKFLNDIEGFVKESRRNFLKALSGYGSYAKNLMPIAISSSVIVEQLTNLDNADDQFKLAAIKLLGYAIINPPRDEEQRKNNEFVANEIAKKIASKDPIVRNAAIEEFAELQYYVKCSDENYDIILKSLDEDPDWIKNISNHNTLAAILEILGNKNAKNANSLDDQEVQEVFSIIKQITKSALNEPMPRGDKILKQLITHEVDILPLLDNKNQHFRIQVINALETKESGLTQKETKKLLEIYKNTEDELDSTMKAAKKALITAFGKDKKVFKSFMKDLNDNENYQNFNPKEIELLSKQSVSSDIIAELFNQFFSKPSYLEAILGKATNYNREINDKLFSGDILGAFVTRAEQIKKDLSAAPRAYKDLFKNRDPVQASYKFLLENLQTSNFLLEYGDFGKILVEKACKENYSFYTVMKAIAKKEKAAGSKQYGISG
ncbi:MAG: hypothetical protein WCJ33_05265, partial [Pseudomonadota bacterium]